MEKPCFQNIKEFNIITKNLKKLKTEIIVNHSRRFIEVLKIEKYDSKIILVNFKFTINLLQWMVT